jgi:hypothetical protein
MDINCSHHIDRGIFTALVAVLLPSLVIHFPPADFLVKLLPPSDPANATLLPGHGVTTHLGMVMR